MTHPTLRRAAQNVTFVRVTLAAAWISMVALLSLFALFLGDMSF